MIAEALSRRQMLESAGALFVAFSLGGAEARAAQPAGDAPPAPRSNAFTRVDSWLAVDRNNDVTIYTGKIECGNGMETAYLQIVADELDVPFERCSLVMGSTAVTPDQGKSTASSAVAFSVQPLRVAAAEARNAFVGLAAQKLNLAPSALTTDAGYVHAIADPSQRVAYGSLIGPQSLAIDMRLGQPNPFSQTLVVRTPLQSYKKLNAVGKSYLRRDVPKKVDGTFEYIHNVRVPGMLHGRAIRPPAPGSRLLSVDPASLAGIPGARLVRRGDFVGVVAPKEADAVRAAAALKLTWKTPPPLPPVTPATQYDMLRKAPPLGSYDVVKVGDADAALASKPKKLTAQYNFPYQLHGMIGPSCAVADVRPGGATLWSGTQWPNGTRTDVAKLLGLDPETVQLVWRESSGAYGRMASDDALADAALMSQIVGKPVRVQWMRHDEHGWEPISPGVALDVQGSLTDDGRVDAFSLQYYAGSTAVSEAGGLLAWRLIGSAPGNSRLSGFPNELLYETIPARHVRATWVTTPFRTLYLRAPGAQQGTFATEGFMDELASAAGTNPIDFRLKHITNERDRNLLQEIVRMSGWNGSPSAGRGTGATMTGRGVAITRNGPNTQRIAVAAQVTVDRATGTVRTTNLWIAADVGLIVNPDGLLNQMEGGALQGLSRSLKEEVKFNGAGQDEADWRSYPILRFSEVPEVKVSLLNRPNDPPAGAGELGNVAVTAAVANAIFDATGKRIREAPFTPERVRALFA